MSLPSVAITTQASGPSGFPQIEGVALFIGTVTSGGHALTAIGPSTDLVATFGADLDLNLTLRDAIANGDSNWKAWAIGHTAGEHWTDVVDLALPGCAPEFIVVCKPVTAQADLAAMQTKAAALLTLNRRMFFLAAFAGPAAQTWAAYVAAAAAITNTLAAQRVVVVPQIFGHELGARAGRIALDKVSRSSARVRTGAVNNPGALPSDNVPVKLTLATLDALNTDRFSVFMWYEGLDGIYFGNDNTLDPVTGAFPNLEWLRVADKAARNVRLQAIAAIADDNVDNTPGGLAAFEAFLSFPLRQMVSAREIRPLAKDAVVATFTSITAVSVAITIQPMNAPKAITIVETLDTTTP